VVFVGRVAEEEEWKIEMVGNGREKVRRCGWGWEEGLGEQLSRRIQKIENRTL
jgi:hypothetical protein